MPRRQLRVPAWLLLLLVAACGGRDDPAPRAEGGAASSPAPEQPADAAVPTAGGLALGAVAPEISGLPAARRIVLVFYRGHWCPASRAELGELQQHLPELERAGAALVAVGVDGEADRDTLTRKLSLAFPLLEDAGLAWTDAYGVREEGTDHPRLALFVLDASRKLLWRHVGEDTDDRPTAAEVLAAARGD